MALREHVPIIREATRILVLRHIALRVHPDPCNDNRPSPLSPTDGAPEPPPKVRSPE